MLRTMLGCAIVVSILGLGRTAIAAPVCPLMTTAPHGTRIFANLGSQNAWREFRAVPDISTLSINGGMLGEYWQENKKARTAYTVERGQNFWISTRYCFDGAGNLEGLGFEIDTALGWGHRAEGFVSSGGFDETSSEFFIIKSGKIIPRPQGVNDVPRALKPILYMNQSELPFASFLPGATRSKRHARSGITSSPTESIADSHRTPAGN